MLLSSLHGYRSSWVIGDLVAALTLLAIAVPEQLATARLAGMPPITGWYAFVAGSVMFALLGSNPQMSVGADSTIAPLFAVGIAAVASAGSPDYVALIGILAVMVGVAVALVGLLRLGWVAEFLSAPIISGFLGGVAIIILVHQLPDLLGLPGASGSTLHRLGVTLSGLHSINGWALGIGVGVFAVVVVAERVDRRLPGALVGLISSTILVAALNLRARGVMVLGASAHGAPYLGLHGLCWSALGAVAPIAGVVALVIVSQTAATTRAFADQGAYEVDVNRDFLGVGAGNVLAGLVGAFPVDASPPRTAAVVSASGRTQVAGLAAAGALVLLTPAVALLEDLPLATLAAILIFVATRIVHIRRSRRHRPLRPFRIRTGSDHPAHGRNRRRRTGHHRRGRVGHPRPHPPHRPPAPARPGPHPLDHQLGPPRWQRTRHRSPRGTCGAVRDTPLVCQRQSFQDRLDCRGRPRRSLASTRRARRDGNDRHRLHRERAHCARCSTNSTTVACPSRWQEPMKRSASAWREAACLRGSRGPFVRLRRRGS